MRHRARHCTCPEGPHRASTTSFKVVPTYHFGYTAWCHGLVGAPDGLTPPTSAPVHLSRLLRHAWLDAGTLIFLQCRLVHAHPGSPTGDCPVRALKMYRRRTKHIRSPKQRQLFISFNPAHSNDIRATSLSRWIKLLIIEAYKSLNIAHTLTDPMPLISPRAHEVRAWASTLAFRSVAMSDLLSTAYWRSEDTFLNYYLRDISRRKEDGTWGLPSCVAASVPLSSSSSL